MNWITVEDTIDPTHPYAPIAVESASYILFKLTGEKFQGVHTVKESYTRDSSSSGVYGPMLVDGQMYNLPLRNSIRHWSNASQGMLFADGERNLYLRHNPVLSVQSVSIDGVTLDPSTYSIRNRKYLVREGNKKWVFDVNTEIIVEYTYGAKPPAAGIAAAIRLANEFIYLETGDERCALPVSVTSVNRQNVSITVVDPQEFIDKGKVGIYSIDLFIKACNPDGSRKKTRLGVAGRPRSERIN